MQSNRVTKAEPYWEFDVSRRTGALLPGRGQAVSRSELVKAFSRRKDGRGR
jgi:hypothetical protein